MRQPTVRFHKHADSDHYYLSYESHEITRVCEKEGESVHSKLHHIGPILIQLHVKRTLVVSWVFRFPQRPLSFTKYC